MTKLDNLPDIPERKPSKTELIYDLYKNLDDVDDIYSIYIVAKYSYKEGSPVSYTLYQHNIDPNGRARKGIEN